MDFTLPIAVPVEGVFARAMVDGLMPIAANGAAGGGAPAGSTVGGATAD